MVVLEDFFFSGNVKLLSVTLQDSTVIVAGLTVCTDFHCTKNILHSERPDCYE